METTQQFGSVDIHQHLGRKERLHYTLFDLTRAMAAHILLDMETWPYMVEYAAYTRHATKLNVLGMTPYESWYGRGAEIQLDFLDGDGLYWPFLKRFKNMIVLISRTLVEEGDIYMKGIY